MACSAVRYGEGLDHAKSRTVEGAADAGRPMMIDHGTAVGHTAEPRSILGGGTAHAVMEMWMLSITISKKGKAWSLTICLALLG